MELNTKIHQLRKMSGMTQEQMANKLGISRQTISKWELGTSVPDWGSMVKIGKLFSVSLDDFVFSDKEKDALDSAPRLTLEDLIELEKIHRKRLLLLIVASIFFVISILSIIVISIVNNSMLSMQYTLYRYIAVEEYTFSPPDYFCSYFFAIISGIISICLVILYFLIPKIKKGFLR